MRSPSRNHNPDLRRAAGAFLRHASLPLLLAAILFGCSAMEEPKAAARAPQSLALEGLEPLMEDQQGKVVVANFWATWCQPCVAEMPELARFYETYKDKPVTFLSLSVDTRRDFEAGKVQAFMDKHELPFPVYVIDSRDPDAVAVAMNIDWSGTLPATFVFDSKGELQEMFDGEVTADDLVKAVEPLLP